MGPTVLVIDDDEDFRELVATVLEGMGARMLQAATGAEGIALLSREQGKVAVVLLDYLMPGMGPKDCVLALSRLIDPSHVVLCTAAVDAAARAAELGLPRWLRKPFSLQELERLLPARPGVAPSGPAESSQRNGVGHDNGRKSDG
jgi:CheY-like chemotaxis protein